ncbi:MAG: 4'-phosphopantetheinyl transferase superfamily protein [Bacteroidota bacterium]
MSFIPLSSQIPGVSIGAWHIEEEELFFLERVKLYENEWVRLGNIEHPQKRLEWLSSRLCLKELIKIRNHSRVESLNTQSGKPYLSTNSHFISYTHSTKYSAAIASTECEVGIDLEYLKRKRNFRTSYLWMNEAEVAFFEQHKSHELFLLMWSAKETLYKILGQGFAFKHNLFLDIENFELKRNGFLPASVQKDDFHKHYLISYQFCPEFVLTYTSDCFSPSSATIPFSKEKSKVYD